jgi:hypothetical protein
MNSDVGWGVPDIHFSIGLVRSESISADETCELMGTVYLDDAQELLFLIGTRMFAN